MLKIVPLLVLLIMPSISLRSQDTGAVSASGALVNATLEVNRTDLIDFAKQYLGTPYCRGSSSPKKGFDCSGFVNFVFRHFNVTLPRSSREYKSLGTALKPEEFKVGDVLIFYGFRDRGQIGHVGIVCEADGVKSRFIHASSGRAHAVTISELGSEGYKRRFYKCIDMIKQP